MNINKISGKYTLKYIDNVIFCAIIKIRIGEQDRVITQKFYKGHEI